MSASSTHTEALTRAYLAAVLWAETDNADETGGLPLERNYTLEDFAPEALTQARAVCAAFLAECGEKVEEALDNGATIEEIGADLWCNRVVGHGCGFWDGSYPEEIGEPLDLWCKGHSTETCYVGDDGRLYFYEEGRFSASRL